jgi:hypothetical protein
MKFTTTLAAITLFLSIATSDVFPAGPVQRKTLHH